MPESVKRPVNWKLVAIILGAVLTIAAIVIIVVLCGILSGGDSNDDSSPKVLKKHAATDAANLRSVIAEAYINVMSDSSFVAPIGSNTKTLKSLEEAAQSGGTGYYTDISCKSHPGATLVVTIDSNNNVDAYFLAEDGTHLTLDYLCEMAESHNNNENYENDFGSMDSVSGKKAKAGTDAANLRSVIAESYINVMADSNFKPITSGTTRILSSLEEAAKNGGTGYYTEVSCKSQPNAKLVVEIDSNNNVDAYFLTKSGEKLNLEYFVVLAGTG